MASLIRELINVLDQVELEYQSLLQISKKKTTIIVTGNVEELQKMVADEQVYLDKIANIENKRAEIVNDIATVLNKDVDTLTIRAIVDLLQGQEKEQSDLAQVHDRLRRTLKDMVVVNDMNMGLIKESLEMVDYNINLYNSLRMGPETVNYSKNAYNVGPQQNSGAFDAKQ